MEKENQNQEVEAVEKETFICTEMDLRKGIMGEIVKEIQLLSYSGYEKIDNIIKEELKKYYIEKLKKEVN